MGDAHFADVAVVLQVEQGMLLAALRALPTSVISSRFSLMSSPTVSVLAEFRVVGVMPWPMWSCCSVAHRKAWGLSLKMLDTDLPCWRGCDDACRGGMSNY